MDVSDPVGGRCRVCRCFLEHEDLFCPNCGTENQAATAASAAAAERIGKPVGEAAVGGSIATVLAFQCDSCGASMSYDASSQSLRCPFCGSSAMHKLDKARTLRPEAAIPLRAGREQVEAELRKWLGKGFWSPGDVSAAAVIASATAVYVPFWAFSARTRTNWTGDQAAPAFAKADWRAISGDHSGTHDGVLVVAGSALTAAEVDSVLPFELDAAVGPAAIDLENVTVEDFRLPRSEARLLARGRIERAEAAAVTRYFEGRSRNVRVNVEISGMHGRTLLAPVWIMVYRYRDKPYRVLVNGQTGKTAGSAPVSAMKITAAVLLAVVAILVALAVMALASR